MARSPRRAPLHIEMKPDGNYIEKPRTIGVGHNHFPFSFWCSLPGSGPINQTREGDIHRRFYFHDYGGPIVGVFLVSEGLHQFDQHPLDAPAKVFKHQGCIRFSRSLPVWAWLLFHRAEPATPHRSAQ